MLRRPPEPAQPVRIADPRPAPLARVTVEIRDAARRAPLEIRVPTFGPRGRF